LTKVIENQKKVVLLHPEKRTKKVVKNIFFRQVFDKTKKGYTFATLFGNRANDWPDC
jgi:hypothetical protein